jgi:hypothetical protein
MASSMAGTTLHVGILLGGVLVVVPLIAGSRDGVTVDPEPRVEYQYDSSMRFGIRVVRDAAGKPTSKVLTFSQNGTTNNTVLRIDGKESVFGVGAGKWLERDKKLPADPGRHAVNGSTSTWFVNDIAVSQILEIVPSKQPVEVKPGVQQRLLDTCLIRYVIENKDSKPRKVGLRIMIDTQIGGNDGVPFTVPGLGLVDTMKDFPTAKEVPEFVQALETGNLLKPGTVGHLSLKIAGLESPDRVSLTHWPGSSAPWEVPIKPIKEGRFDSAIVLYWQERELRPGEKRELGFAYGLGSISSTERTGHLALTVDGQFDVGQLFTATAYVNNPSKGESLTLILPKGLERSGGADKEPVPPLAAQAKEGNSIVSWKIKALAPGQFTIKVVSSVGLEATKSVTILAAPIIDSKTKAKTDPWSAVDALDALAMSVRLIPERREMDVDDDGRVTSRDAAVILQRVAAQVGKSGSKGP